MLQLTKNEQDEPVWYPGRHTRKLRQLVLHKVERVAELEADVKFVAHRCKIGREREVPRRGKSRTSTAARALHEGDGMTRKDFELIAKVLCADSTWLLGPMGLPVSHINLATIAHAFANALGAAHPRFNREKFLRACGVEK
jgi:hypothetical protein